MEKTPSASVTDTELSILTAQWDQGPEAMRDIVDRVYGTRFASIHATVNSLLERLDEKGDVGRDRSGHSHLYQAVVDRQLFVGQQLQ